MTTIRLGQIAHARSGDKGSDANVGVIARQPAGYTLLRELLTPQRVADYFAHLGLLGVQRYDLPNLRALNFILRGALGEGGSRSLRIDAQGKAFGAAILQMPLEVDEARLAECLDPNGEGAVHG